MLSDGSDLARVAGATGHGAFLVGASAARGGALDGKPLAFGSAGYVVLSYALATRVLRDSRFKNAALNLMEKFGITAGSVHEFRAQSILMAEGPQHMRLRTPLARFMGPNTVEEIRGVLRDILSDIMHDISGQVPFHTAVADPIPARIYCYLAGAPATDAPKVASLSARTLSLLSRDTRLAPVILNAYDELFDYLRNLVARKKADGLGNDMLSFLIKEQEAGKLSPEELLNDATAMLEASSVNTSHQIGLTIWTLLRNREVWSKLKGDETLIPAAVVEATRLFPRPGIVSKIATESVDLDGVVISQDTDVHVAIWSANRDPERFERPGEFDLQRERNQPLTFSTGAHGCLGQSLARVEMEEVVRYLVTFYPNSVVVDEGTEVAQVGGRWLVKSLTVDLRQ
ncbi:cytochrome P450 [Bradyrhizobium sp. SSUT18]|uniref:cytochrome P450 n=1 Tax=Bradyrhizobium sp. SSUT18 TaxID=3040602 RepID=UPI00244BBE0A|nr:cytochrome P450 [Bradyrhizobium sp. SSUT18]MDH2401806.1 cytochrome P450 [Bradyrhizobium sp. SSUT18]